MQLEDIPFSHFIGLKESGKEGVLLELPESRKYHNHIGTVHASAQFALAETASGFIMKDAFSDIAEDVIAVVRKAEVKYSKPAQGALFASGALSQVEIEEVKEGLKERGLAKLRFTVLVKNNKQQITMKAKFEWSVLLKKENENGRDVF